jgi:hypothetical protein
MLQSFLEMIKVFKNFLLKRFEIDMSFSNRRYIELPILYISTCNEE